MKQDDIKGDDSVLFHTYSIIETLYIYCIRCTADRLGRWCPENVKSNKAFSLRKLYKSNEEQ